MSPRTSLRGGQGTDGKHQNGAEKMAAELVAVKIKKKGAIGKISKPR